MPTPDPPVHAHDFAQLALSHPPLAAFLGRTRTGASALDFSNPQALRELCYAICWHDYKLRIEFPLDSLIPTVPGRVAYLEWVNGLLDSNSKRPALGLDIGVGCSCIYPLLGVKLFDWNFVGTETDPRAIEYAEDNVNRNRLHDRIRIVGHSGPQIFPSELNETFDFSVCNPPFYAHDEDFADKEGAATGINTGRIESITTGGELSFFLRLFSESRQNKRKVKWWTCLIGKKGTLEAVKEALGNEGVEVRIGTFRPGKTVRWAIGWRWND